MVAVCLQIFPIIIYFSAVINILYYWGVMQKVVSGIAWLMQFTMLTTAIESLNAACNIFVGMVCQNILSIVDIIIHCVRKKVTP